MLIYYINKLSVARKKKKYKNKELGNVHNKVVEC